MESGGCRVVFLTTVGACVKVVEREENKDAQHWAVQHERELQALFNSLRTNVDAQVQAVD